ncbi:hypothetical protein [Duganella sp. 1411]|uniref:hypothetical protein n=1 Tax=Duganella sp. 1411 TaxID=2806572 RepID=UPI001AE6CE58|nr:hypothetical protein [Duganella sp. 1411]
MNHPISSRPTTLPDLCILCGEADAVSKEHVYAAWIGRIHKFGAIKAHYQKTSATGTTKTTEDNFLDKTLPVLCDACNTRWGSDLQDAASAILKPLIKGGEWPALSRKKLHAIAMWATSFAMVREYMYPELVTFEQEKRTRFRKEETIPEGINVWMGAYDGTRDLLTWHRAMFDGFDTGVSQPNTALFVFTIYKVIFVVFSTSSVELASPYSTRNYMLGRCAHAHNLRRVWPNEGIFPAGRPLPVESVENLMPELYDQLAGDAKWLLDRG